MCIYSGGVMIEYRVDEIDGVVLFKDDGVFWLNNYFINIFGLYELLSIFLYIFNLQIIG